MKETWVSKSKISKRWTWNIFRSGIFQVLRSFQVEKQIGVINAVDGWAVVITTEQDGEKNLKNHGIIYFSGEQQCQKKEMLLR